MRKLATRVKELRTERGLTMLELEKETGVSRTSIWRWENGLADAKGDELIKLSRYFKVSTDYLLGESDY